MIDSDIINNFSSHISGGLIAWYTYVLVCILVLARCRLLVKVLCWIPLILTICYYVFSNNINRSAQRSEFLHSFSSGVDISSAEFNDKNPPELLDKALSRYRVVMFDVHLNDQGVAVFTKNSKNNETASSKARSLLFTKTMDICRSKNVKVVVNVRHYESELLQEVIDYIKRHELTSAVVITSFDAIVPFMVKKKESKILTGLSYSSNGITTHFQKVHPQSLFFKYLGQFLDEVMQLVMHNLLLPKFIGCDMLFVDQDDVSLSFIKTAGLSNITVVGTNVNVKVAAQWMTVVAKIPYFVTHLR